MKFIILGILGATLLISMRISFLISIKGDKNVEAVTKQIKNSLINSGFELFVWVLGIAYLGFLGWIAYMFFSGWFKYATQPIEVAFGVNLLVLILSAIGLAVLEETEDGKYKLLKWIISWMGGISAGITLLGICAAELL